MNRRGFLKVSLGATALAALPALAARPPAAPVVTGVDLAAGESRTAVLHWLAGPVGLRVITADGGASDFALPPLDLTARGDELTFKLAEPFRFWSDRLMTITDLRIFSRPAPDLWIQLPWAGGALCLIPGGSLTVVPTGA